MLQQLVLQIFDLPRMRQDRGLNASWVSNKQHIQSIRTQTYFRLLLAYSVTYSKSGNTSLCVRSLLTNSSKIFSVEFSKFARKLPEAIRTIFRYFRMSPKTSKESELAKG